nr:CapA family protein [Agrobacterium sp. rho-8.1]
MNTPLSIVLCGDTLPVHPLENISATARAVFDVAAGGDFSLGNFEIPLTRRGAPIQKLLNIRANPSIADSLRELGLDVATIANNHAVDYGVEGLSDTAEHLEAAGIRAIGAGTNLDEAFRPFFRDVAGRRVGVIAFSCLTPTGMSAASDRAGIAGLHIETGYEIDPWYQMEEPGDPSVIRIRTRVREADMVESIARVSEAKSQCDILIVTLHWGFGSGEELAEYQRPLAERLIEAGADIIHGHHPHAIHAFGFYQGKPIIFSAGTYVGQQVFLDAAPAVKRLWARMSADGFVTTLIYPDGADPLVTLRPTTLDADRLPRLVDGIEFTRIYERLQRLSAEHGAELKTDGKVITARPL